MTPKLKAVQIILKMQFQKETLSFEQGKQCALIAVNELIYQLVEIGNQEFAFIYNVEYWQEVKQEIEKL
jgi:hypothetical protein